MISWVTVVWSIMAAFCLTLAAVHLLVWARNRRMSASIWFAIYAVSLAGLIAFEFLLMRAGSVTAYTELHQQGHLVMFVLFVSILGFVQSYFRTGRPWLLKTLVAIRVVILLLAFFPGPTFNFREIHSLGNFELFGESVSVAEGVASPYARLGEFSGILLLVFILDAAIKVWRRGDARSRQRALVVGGAAVLSVALPLGFSLLLHTGLIRTPYMASLGFIVLLVAMGSELCRDLIEAAKLSDELRETTESMQLAAEAAKLALWR